MKGNDGRHAVFLAAADHAAVSTIFADGKIIDTVKMECVARLKDGNTSLDAAHFQMNLSGSSLTEMLRIMESRYTEMGDTAKAEQCLRISKGVLDVFRNEGGKELEIAGNEWIDF